MEFAGLALAAGLALVVSALWWTLAIRGVRQALGTSGPIGLKTLPAQALIMGALAQSLLFGPVVGMLALILPATNIAAFLWPPSWPAEFIQRIAAVPLIIGAITCALCLPMRTTRMAALCVGVTASTFAALVIGEATSHRAMCETARAEGLTHVRRNTLLWSLANTPREFQLEVHATARLGDRRFAWSYAEMDWYDVPEFTFARVENSRPACP